MGLDNRVPFPEGQSVQFLSGFIYPADNQAIKLPDGTSVTGRCEVPAQCKDHKGVKRDDITEKKNCTGQCYEKNTNANECSDAGYSSVPCPGNKLAAGDKSSCTNADGIWVDHQWSEATAVVDFDDRHKCENDNEQHEWISYTASKYVESAFLPGEEWRRQAGFRWEELGTTSADGWFLPSSAQFRKPVAVCVIQSCVGGSSTGDEKTRSTCETAGGTFETKKTYGLTPAACEALGGCSLRDAGDDFDEEIPKGSLPSFYSPTIDSLVGSGIPTALTLNPYASGHHITVVARNANLDEKLGDAAIRKADYGEKFAQLGKEGFFGMGGEDAAGQRPVALRGPVIMAGWGYDDENQPVPNEYYDADEFTLGDDGEVKVVYAGHCSSAGTCDNDSHGSAADCDKAGAAWTAYSSRENCAGAGACSSKGSCSGATAGTTSTNQDECGTNGGTWGKYNTEKSCTDAGKAWTTGKWKGVPQNKAPERHFYFNHLKRPDKWKVGPIDLRWDRERKVWMAASPNRICLSKATRCILPQAGPDGKNSFNFGILDNINAPGRLYRNPCSYANCEYGTYFPQSVSYPDIEIYDPEDREWCGNCEVKKDNKGNYFVTCQDFHTTCVPFYDAVIIRDMKHYPLGRGVSTDCGDKFNKNHRGDPYSRRMGNPCHEFGSSITGPPSEKHPLSDNNLYPQQAKTILYERVLIENPLGQALMLGDSFLSMDTGKRITIEYVRKKKGTGSSNCTGSGATAETVKESLPIHIIIQGEFYGQEILTSMGCEQGESSACSKKIMVQGMSTMEDCGPNDDYPLSAASY